MNASLAIPIADLSADPVLEYADRVELNGVQVPSLAGFALAAKLGQGGMGVVYYGFDPELKRGVAVKVLPKITGMMDPRLRERFTNEAQFGARLQSPHLVGVFGLKSDTKTKHDCLVLEFVRGASASKHVAKAGKTGLPEAAALAVGIGACQGLKLLHLEKIVHRDVKPDNILIPHRWNSEQPDFGAAKLADLGLARDETQPPNVALTRMSQGMGTEGFMAPEQFFNAGKASFPADVFGLGATLYALLSGGAPFEESDAYDVRHATKFVPHTPIRQLRPDVSMPLARLIDRCLEKEPANRYTDAQELLEALQECAGRRNEAAPNRGEMRQALTNAIPDARYAREKGDWALAVELLDALAAHPANADHPNRKSVEMLLTEAKAELAKQKRARDRAGKTKTELLTEARKLFDEAEDIRASTSATKDWQQAAALFEQASEIYKDAGDKKWQGKSNHHRAWCFHPNHNPPNPAGSWQKAIELYELAARLEGEGGDKAEQGRSVHVNAWCLEPTNNPAGDWNRAIALYELAARYKGEAGDTVGQAKSTYQQAWCYQPDHNPGGDWAKAIALYDAAARLEGTANSKAEQGRSIHSLAWCHQPNNNPKGDWAKARGLYETAARLKGEAGDKASQGESFHMLAFCMIQGASKNMTDAARQLFQRAADLRRAAGDEAGAKLSESWLK